VAAESDGVGIYYYEEHYAAEVRTIDRDPRSVTVLFTVVPLSRHEDFRLFTVSSPE